MRAIVQRVEKSELYIEEKLYSKIGKGFLVLLGVTESDTEADMKALADKIIKLRVFEDENEKMNLSIIDVAGELQIVSQFTLYADSNKGNRPSYINAMNQEEASKLYDIFNKELSDKINTQTGIFRADMQVELINDGPITIIIEK